MVARSVFWSWRNVSPMLPLQMPRHALQCCIKDINATPTGRMLEQSGSGFLNIEIGISWRLDRVSEIKVK